jgi:hypothetical protein
MISFNKVSQRCTATSYSALGLIVSVISAVTTFLSQREYFIHKRIESFVLLLYCDAILKQYHHDIC